jgi:hypothetical protein
MVPDSSPRASKGVLVLAWRLLSHFFARGPAFLGCISFRWVRASAPAGCSPQGLGGVVWLFRGLSTFCDASAGLVVPSCELVVARCIVRFWVLGLVCWRCQRFGRSRVCESSPEPPHRARGRLRTDSAFFIRPFIAFSQGGGGERHVALGGRWTWCLQRVANGWSEWTPVPHSIRVG